MVGWHCQPPLGVFFLMIPGFLTTPVNPPSPCVWRIVTASLKTVLALTDRIENPASALIAPIVFLTAPGQPPKTPPVAGEAPGGSSSTEIM
ncbi:hypothetical protein B0T21DRAFT_91371 [Apiosordaria backusii]|uniref:Secreted protein n=1 Tax=Apiosordaria backusii TaxID=314023 RepID=A0AA40ESI4_9PEZI|nr:hypothetical protein B0T21DRAFT_91371 [Apiosordaria backusii]